MQIQNGAPVSKEFVLFNLKLWRINLIDQTFEEVIVNIK